MVTSFFRPLPSMMVLVWTETEYNFPKEFGINHFIDRFRGLNWKPRLEILCSQPTSPYTHGLLIPSFFVTITPRILVAELLPSQNSLGCLWVQGFFWGWWWKVSGLKWWWLHNFVNMLKPTELYIFERVNFMVCELYFNCKITHGIPRLAKNESTTAIKLLKDPWT